MTYNADNPLTVVELFAGYGSQRMALERLKRDSPGFDYKVLAISEIEPAALRAYEAVHGDCPNLGDISKIEWGKHPELKDTHLLTYSFPCTSISTAGRREGLSEGSGTASSLLWEVRRAIETLRPRLLLMENVKALLQEKFMPEFRRWCDTLADFGYTNRWQVLNARDYGVPQNRERVFMVSALGGEGYAFPKPFKLGKRLRDILEPSAPPEYYLKDWQAERVLRSLKTAPADTDTQPVNTLPGGVAPTLTAHYGRSGYTELVNKGTYSPGIAVAEKQPAIQCIGSYAKSSICSGKVVAPSGISPAIMANFGDMLAVTEPTPRQVSITFKEMPNGNIRGVNGKGGGSNASEWQLTHPDNVSPTVTSSLPPKILAMRRDRKPPYSERRAEIQQGDWSNTLTATGNERENLLLEAPFRIRKVTPREAFRLMDVSEEDIDKIQAAGLSKSAQYKLAGNSIVVSCLYHLFRTMLIPGQPEKAPARQLSIF